MSGSFTVGDKGVMMLPHWAMPSFYSNGKPMEIEVVRRGIASNHYHEWVARVRGERDDGDAVHLQRPADRGGAGGDGRRGVSGGDAGVDSAGLEADHDGATALVHRQVSRRLAAAGGLRFNCERHEFGRQEKRESLSSPVRAISEVRGGFFRR